MRVQTLDVRKRKSTSDGFNGLLRGLRPLAQQIKELQNQHRKLGLFAEDRDTLKCLKCGLQEDVTFEGLLVVTRPSNRKRDTGLRFKALDKNDQCFRCPSCNSTIKGKPF